jgi:release factor glutamine methyltransferase
MSQTIVTLLQKAINTLKPVSDSPQLDAEILLSFVLNTSRTYLHTWPEKIISIENENRFQDFLNRRLQHEPIAYITGHQEFWSLDFLVTKDTLIPRPETELLVELALQYPRKLEPVKLLDLGTGTGAIALSIAKERPHWEISAADITQSALNIAKRNAQRLQINNIIFYESNWFDNIPKNKFDIIISNPPYIENNDSHLSKLRYEPQSALISGMDGLEAITNIISHALLYLNPNGLLMLEHGFQQAAKVRGLLADAGFTQIISHIDLSGWERVTVGSSLGYTQSN